MIMSGAHTGLLCYAIKILKETLGYINIEKKNQKVIC